MLDLAKIALQAAPGAASGLDHDVDEGGMQHDFGLIVELGVATLTSSSRRRRGPIRRVASIEARTWPRSRQNHKRRGYGSPPWRGQRGKACPAEVAPSRRIIWRLTICARQLRP